MILTKKIRGVIILGVKEDKSGNWHTTGLKNAAKLKKDFWDTINNRKKVSINLLKDDDVETYLVAGTDNVIMVIWVPGAKREQMRRGGKSDPRNKSLLKMFNLIDIGEHAGSGVPNIFNVWEDEGWEEPDIKESFDPDRTSLILKFIKKQAIKTSDKKQAIKTSDKKQAIKTKNNQEKIRLYLQRNETAKAKDIAKLLGLSMARTREILSMMDDVQSIGRNKTRIYRLRKEFLNTL